MRAERELTEHGDLELLRDGLELLKRFGSGLAEVDNDLPDLNIVRRLCDASTRRSRQSSTRPRSRGRDPEGCALSSCPRVASLLWLRPMRTMLRPDLAICLANSRPMSPVGPVMAARREEWQGGRAEAIQLRPLWRRNLLSRATDAPAQAPLPAPYFLSCKEDRSGSLQRCEVRRPKLTRDSRSCPE